MSLVTSIVADRAPVTSGANATSNEHESLLVEDVSARVAADQECPGISPDSFDSVMVIGVALVFVIWTVCAALV